MRVLCAGHVNWDVTLRVDHLPAPDAEARIRDRREGGGGSAANVAVALANLDVGVDLVGSVGDDRAGRRAREELDDAGVGLDGVQVVAGETAVKYLVVAPDGEAIVLGTDGVNEAVDPGAVPERLFDDAEHCHLTGQAPATAAALARRAREADCTASFDPGRRPDGRDYGATLGAVDLVFGNREAATDVAPPDGAPVVTTRGRDGATVETPGAVYRHDAFDVDAVNSTGAGDAFAAGFLAAWLDDGGRGHDRDYERALAVGSACGALAAEHPGTRPPLDWSDVEALCS